MPTTSDGKDINASGVVLKHIPHLFVVNVPGRDLTEDDVQELVALEKERRELIPVEYDDQGKLIDKPITARSIKAALVASGAYEAVEAPKAEPVTKPDVPAPKEK